MQAAMRLLSRREYSEKELRRRLVSRSFALALIESVIEELQHCGYQSDRRFAESYARSRASQGYGLLRIELELGERGVSDTHQQTAIQALELDWFELALEVRHKKFGFAKPEDIKMRAKQWRFLQYRGFTSEQIVYALNVTAPETAESDQADF